METNRKLAHIEIIKEIKEIPGAQNIEVAQVLGWQCVIAKKDNFKVGDKIIYIEIDSVLPEKPEFEFLRSRNFRVRTIKLKGQVSQGLVIPLTILDSYVKKKGGLKFIKSALESGDDVTEYLGITKYLTPSEREEITQQEKKLANEKNKLKKFMENRY